MTHAYCSIFDLDETIIRPKSMLGVLETYYRLNASSPADGELQIEQLRERATAFVATNDDRRAQNRWFYRQMRGIEVTSMRLAAQHWFENMRPALYHDAVVRELSAHQRNGATILIVTGSFREAVEPIMRDLDIRHLVCADLDIVQGKYTGELNSEPTIGHGKADALRGYLELHGIPLDGSYAYGDHDSDIPMLGLARWPVAVGDHPDLVHHAQRNGWRIFHHLQEPQNG
jgi:HAD superfamily hydrolase (TIGR01490 family)